MKQPVIPFIYENGRKLHNVEAAAMDPVFMKACELAGQYPSPRRYRRFKYGHGEAYDAAVKHGLLTNGKPKV